MMKKVAILALAALFACGATAVPRLAQAQAVGAICDDPQGSIQTSNDLIDAAYGYYDLLLDEGGLDTLAGFEFLGDPTYFLDNLATGIIDFAFTQNLLIQYASACP
jgi:hypothetical protein